MTPQSLLASSLYYLVIACLWLEAKLLVLALSLFKKSVRPSERAKSWHLNTGLSGKREALILKLMNAMPGFCRFKAYRDIGKYREIEDVLVRHSDLQFICGGYSYHLHLNGGRSFGYHKDVDVVLVSPRIESLVSELGARGWRYEERSHAHCFFNGLIKIDVFHWEWDAEKHSAYFVAEPNFVAPSHELQPGSIECFGQTIRVAHPAFIARIFSMIRSPNTRSKAQRVLTSYYRDQNYQDAPEAAIGTHALP
ncbi:MAG: hypothetical protein AAGK02_00500 [Pseudomonadota bacterium]